MKRIKLRLFYGPNVVSLQYTSSRHSKESVNGQGKCNPKPTNYTRSLDDPHILSGHVDTNLTGKFAYGFVLHNKKGLLSKLSDIERLALVAIRSIRRTGSSHDIILLHMGTYSSIFFRRTKQLDVRMIDVTNYAKLLAEKIGRCPHGATTNRKGCLKSGWSNFDSCWNRYIFWTLKEYSKIIYLDCDMLVMRNIDHIFSYPALSASLDVFYAMNSHPSVFNAGMMVLEPNMKDFNGLISYAAEHDIWKNEYGALNEYFARCWNLLPLTYNMPALFSTDMLASKQRGAHVENVYIIHFVGLSKPIGSTLKGKPLPPHDYMNSAILNYWRELDSE